MPNFNVSGIKQTMAKGLPLICLPIITASQIRNQNGAESGTEGTTSNTNCTNPNIYRSYILNDYASRNIQTDFSITGANDNEEDLQKIYELDKEAFSEYDAYTDFEDFKNYLLENHLSVYAVKDSNGEFIGYYQAEPIKDGDLYIDSMGLIPSYRNTRKGYLAINQCWDEIQKYALENGAKSMSLHVNADKRALKNMYERLGFTLEETLDNYYGNGVSAHFMTKQLTPVESNSQVESTEPSITPEEAEKIRQKEAKRLFDKRVKEATDELKQIAPNAYDYAIGDAIKACSYKNQSGDPVFSEEMFGMVKFITEQSASKETDEYYQKYIIQGNFDYLTERDEDEHYYKARTDLMPYIREWLSYGIQPGKIIDVACRNTKYSPEQGKNIISIDLVKKKLELYNLLKCYHEDPFRCGGTDISLTRLCVLKNADETEYIDEDAYSAIKSDIRNGYSYYEIESLILASIVKDENGNKVFDSDLHWQYRERFDRNQYKIYKSGGLSIHPSDLKKILEQECSPMTYLEYAGMIYANPGIKQLLGIYNTNYGVAIDGNRWDSDAEKSCYDSDIINICAILKAVTTEYKDSYGNTQVFFDSKAFDAIKEICSNPENFEKLEDHNWYSSKFHNLVSLASIVKECKPTNDYDELRFNPDMLEKVKLLKAKEVPDVKIIELLRQCKLKEQKEDYNIKTHKWEPITKLSFSNEAFDAYYNSIEVGERYPDPERIGYSIEIHNGKEGFNPVAYELLKDAKEAYDYLGSHKPTFDAFRYKSCDGETRVAIGALSTYVESGVPLNYAVDSLSNDYNNPVYSFNLAKMEAYKTLKSRGEIPYTRYEGDMNSNEPIKNLMYVVSDKNYNIMKFNQDAFDALIELLDEGVDGRDAEHIIYCCKEYYGDEHRFSPEAYKFYRSLVSEGISISTACNIVSNTISNGIINESMLEKYKELYSLGFKTPSDAYCTCINNKKFNEVAYECLKDAKSKGFSEKIITNCEVNGEFNDSIYRKALILYEKGYDTITIEELMRLCHTKKEIKVDEDETVVENYFSQEIFNNISELEKLGIDKKNIPNILSACKYGYYHKEYYSSDAFSKVHELKNRGFSDLGIAKFIECVRDDKGKIDEDKYADLIWLTARHKDLKDVNHDDDYVVERINNHKNDIKTAYELFGQDVMNFAMSARIDNYVEFAHRCREIKEKCSDSFVKDLQSRLNMLPSPDLKVKRLRLIGGLAGKVDENALKQLTIRIKSPKVTQEQIALANEIFAVRKDNNEISRDDFYKSQVQRFLDEIHVPQKTRKIVEDYLMEERLDGKIDFPKSIEEQIALMEKFAQLSLTNAKIPLENKIKYIDEYKVKLADMQANPDKYTSPRIFAKPLSNLIKVIEAYVNIPNDDTMFESSAKAAMYSNFGIEITPELLSAINYDAKYFDRIFAMKSDTVENFKKLIELQKADCSKNLTELRMSLPEEGTELYERFSKYGLIEQIKANLDTKRQFIENNLKFEYWNQFDPNLKGETFTVEADPETEYKNIKFNIINVFQDELWNKMDSAETEKLMEHLSACGYTIFNNHIYRGGQEIADSELENFANTVVKYIESNKYFCDHVNSAGNALSQDEIEGITGFCDHIRGHQNRIRQVKNARTVKDIHFRLSDESNIGRNTFFGNHVGCCNSIEADHAGYSAPMHLMNAYNRGIELVDEYENSYGNSRCFFALVDGKVTFVIDSFEANGKLASNPLVTENLVKFAKQVCVEMGRPDAEIVVGPNFNHMDMSLFKETGGHTIKVIGTVSDRTYCDVVGGKVRDEINQTMSDRHLYVLK